VKPPIGSRVTVIRLIHVYTPGQRMPTEIRPGHPGTLIDYVTSGIRKGLAAIEWDGIEGGPHYTYPRLLEPSRE
jgi:hypothetical protein